MNAPSLSADVVVLGAGPAGLGAALRAAELGYQVVLCERAQVVGGLAASFEVAGRRVDHGSHRLHPAMAPDVMAAVHRLLGDDLQVRPRRGRIRMAGRWLGFPLQAGDLVRSLPPSMAARAAFDAATSPLRRPRADTFAEHVRAGLGPTVAEAFHLPYARKLWGVPGEELSADLARRRVTARSPMAVAQRLVRARRPEGRTFLYPRLGFGQISERLAEEAVAAGVDLRLGREVVRIELRDDGRPHRVRLAGGQLVEAPVVFTSLPAGRLAQLASPMVPDEVRAAAGRLRHRAAVLVYLVLDQDRYTPFDAHYFPELTTRVARLSEPKNYRDGPDAPGRTVLCLEVPADPGDDVWRASPDDLGARFAEDLARQGLPKVTPAATEVRRVPHVYPVAHLGSEADLGDVERWAGTWPGLVLFGRQGLFAQDNTHHALAMGWAAAAALRPGGGLDADAWRHSRQSFRAHVVED